MKQMLTIGVLAALVACGQSPTTTQDQSATEPMPAPAAPPATVAALSPQEFAQKAANSDAFEVQAGQLAAQRASRAEVKDFARMMVTDHQATTRELASVAPRVQLTAPTAQLDSTQQADLNTLRGAEGPAFDDMYLDQQVAAHEDAVRTFDGFVNNSPDSPLRQWASTTLPKLRDHLARAQALEAAT